MKKVRNCLKKIVDFKYFYPILLMVYIVAYIYPLIKGYVFGDDSYFHLNNVYYLNKYGLFSKIVPITNERFGWGVGLFYPPLPHFLSAFLGKLLSVSPLMSLRVFKILVMVLTSLAMYFFAFKLCKSRKYAFISALFYISSSYFLVDFYVRDAINELMLFLFTPLVFLSFYYLFNENNKFKFYLLFVIGFSGMIYSHFLVTFFFVLLLIPFLIVFIKEIFVKKYFIHLIIASLIVICFCITYIYPLFLHMGANMWWIPAYKDVWILSPKGYLVYDLYKTSTDNILFIKLNFLAIFLSLMGIKNVVKVKDKYFIGILLFTICSLFLSVFTPFWKICPQFFKNIQCAWRLNVFITFGICVLLANGLKSFYEIFKNKYKYLATAFIVFIIIIFSINNKYKIKFVTINSIEHSSDIITSNHDYFPRKAKKSLKYLDKLEGNEITTLSHSKCDSKVINNKIPNMTFKISGIKEKTTIQLPRFYYLGYKIKDSSGKTINYYETKYGLIGVDINRNDTYTLKYKGVKYYFIAKTLKCISIIVIILYSGYYIIKRKK